MPGAPGIASVSNVLKGVAALIAVVPGLAMITSKINLPGSLQEQLGAIALFLGVVVVLATWLFGQTLRRMKPQRVGLLIMAVAVLGVASALFCASFATRYTVADPDNSGSLLVKPMAPVGQLARDLSRFDGSYEEALRHPRFSSRVRDNMAAQANMAVWVMVLSFLLAQVLLLAAVVIGAWKVAEILEKRRAPATS